MMLLLLQHLLLLYPLLAASSPAAKPPATPKPCTLHSPTSGSFFDLTSISLHPPSSKKDSERQTSWRARGHDYGANFTLNICAPVIEDLAEMGGVKGVEEGRWANVSGYYEYDGERFSIGQQSSTPLFRGRKLVLNYTHGSPCPDIPTDTLLRTDTLLSARSAPLLQPRWREHLQDDDPPQHPRTKSTILSFLCDPSPLSSTPSISFVGTPDSCAYFFEVRSSSSCGGHASDNTETLSPVGVFGIIAGIAVAAYLIGGCAYQRIVLNQRGWRQCPNGAVWRSFFEFIGDFAMILTSSCMRLFPSSRNSRGYTHLSVSADQGGPQRGRTSTRAQNADAENRLIDSLDEEWDS